MAIELHHLHPSHDDEVARLKARIAELEQNLSEIQSQKMQLEDDAALLRRNNAELKEAQRWHKFSEEKPPKYTWFLVSGKSQMGNYIVIRDFFEEDDWVENSSLDDDALDIEYWMPLPSAPKEDK